MEEKIMVLNRIRWEWALALLLAAHGPVAQAMTLERVGADLFATGPVEGADFLSFKEALAQGGVQRVVFVNSPGGDLWTGMQVARMIQSASVHTLASGYCISACSLMFIAGKERFFASGNKPRNTMVGIHGAHDTTTKQVNPQAMPQMYALYKSQMGDKFDVDVMGQALYKIEDAGGLLRARELQRTKTTEQAAWFCPMRATPFDKCQQHPGKNALSLGIVTSADTATVSLPVSMQPKLYFFGRLLPEPKADMAERALGLIDEVCTNPRCKTMGKERMTQWLQGETHRAFAIGSGAAGFGSSFNLDDPGQAIARALYVCNHARDNKKLCKLLAVNEQETHQFYDEIDNQSKAALATLPTPRADAMRSERDEPGAGSPDALRNTAYDQMTPRDIKGVRRIDSAELATLLKAQAPPKLIDVIVSVPVMLPTAIHFMAGGLAFSDEKLEAAFDQRFRDMLNVAVPEKSAPVVFYCVGSQSWHSVNAAMRAVRAGYTNVMWYRGGIQAWQAAGLPTTGKVAVAVIY